MAFLRENGQEIIERPELFEPEFTDIVPIRDFSDTRDGPYGTDKYIKLLNLKQLIYPYRADIVDLGDKSDITISMSAGAYITYRASLMENGSLIITSLPEGFTEAKLIVHTNGYEFLIPAEYVHLDNSLIIDRDILITIYCFNEEIFVSHNAIDLTLINVTNSISDIEASIENINNSLQDISYLLGIEELRQRITALEPSIIESFEINDQSTLILDTGTMLTNPVFTWTLSGSPPYSIDLSNIPIETGMLEHTIIGDYSEDTSWVLTSRSRNNLVSTRSVSLNFKDRVYYGSSSNEMLTNNDILALDYNDFESGLSRAATCNINGLYIYYVYPVYLGTVTNIYINGLQVTDYTEWDISFISVTNITSTYKVIRINEEQQTASVQVSWS